MRTLAAVLLTVSLFGCQDKQLSTSAENPFEKR